jgi:DNA (cytosine-5)-methyltransferase 1
MKKYNVIDLFCGAGGLSLGFSDADFNILLGVDNDKDSLNTFKENFKEAETANIDLFNFHNGEIKKIIGEKKVDVVVGGPPCQGFSLSGTRRKEDPRNKLYLSFFKIVEDFNPKVFLIENVPGMGKLYEGEVKKDIYARAKKLGYNVYSDILTAAEFGVPQMRKRIFFVGIKENLGKFNFPEKEIKDESKYVTCEEAIGDLPALDGEYIGEESMDYGSNPVSQYQIDMRKGSNKLLNHVAAKHTEDVKKVISQVPEGGNYKDLPKGVGDTRNFHEAWTRYHSKKPSKTIDTGHRNHFHYKYNRVPTVRENARLQSFDDKFIFKGPKTQQFKQVGNAVPPRLAFHIAEKIKEVLDSEN